VWEGGDLGKFRVMVEVSYAGKAVSDSIYSLLYGDPVQNVVSNFQVRITALITMQQNFRPEAIPGLLRNGPRGGGTRD